MRVLALTRYGSLGASSRLRFLQYLPVLRERGILVTVAPLFANGMLLNRYRVGKYGFNDLVKAYLSRIQMLLDSKRFDLLWIEKEALPWVPAWCELGLTAQLPLVLDYDDAVFHAYDMHRLSAVRCLFGRRLDTLMRRSSLVVAGNEYLANRASSAGAGRVEVVPTVIDLKRYRVSESHKSAESDGCLRVVWIGSPSTAGYLHLVENSLRRLAVRNRFVLRVIGGGDVAFRGIQTENVPWTEETEVESLRTADIGIMPLLATPWEEGKCGYKLIQYMACGLPCVASAVGVNRKIVVNGQTGLLASDDHGWYAALDELLGDSSRRISFGRAGRERVENYYSLQQTGPVMTRLLEDAALEANTCAE